MVQESKKEGPLPDVGLISDCISRGTLTALRV